MQKKNSQFCNILNEDSHLEKGTHYYQQHVLSNAIRRICDKKRFSLFESYVVYANNNKNSRSILISNLHFAKLEIKII